MKNGRRSCTEKENQTKRESLIKKLQEAFAEVGESPTRAKLKSLGYPSRGAYRNHFGSLTKAKEAAGIPPNKIPIKKSRKPKHKYIPTPRKSRRLLARRFRIFHRDNFKCQYCGRTLEDGIKLQIDHVIPRSKGGKNNDENLITSCFECNVGKSDFLMSFHNNLKKQSPN